ncbi:hypothetical protein N7474_001563 [Penicillium riverlandense]|uniref:uncharacterized protein n=1 Tax=Penicillium riverlandense TaxID=1903569 RepID=UPI002547F6D2|nr:uncharacterized protein N7474_001563 [Penicillium riverlandense]KAJ5833252.1 hypothetical protein N7474_001563 [Penicillium riverlandense]
MSSLSKKEVRSEKVPRNQLFSQALVVDGLVYLSGNTGVDPVTGNVVEGTVEDRATQILKNVSSVLEASGSDIDKAVKVNIFLTSMSDYALMNEAYVKFFKKDPKPASLLNHEMLLASNEID